MKKNLIYSICPILFGSFTFSRPEPVKTKGFNWRRLVFCLLGEEVLVKWIQVDCLRKHTKMVLSPHHWFVMRMHKHEAVRIFRFQTQTQAKYSRIFLPLFFSTQLESQYSVFVSIFGSNGRSNGTRWWCMGMHLEAYHIITGNGHGFGAKVSYSHCKPLIGTEQGIPSPLDRRNRNWTSGAVVMWSINVQQSIALSFVGILFSSSLVQNQKGNKILFDLWFQHFSRRHRKSFLTQKKRI